MRYTARILKILAAFLGIVRAVHGAEPESQDINASTSAPTVATGHSEPVSDGPANNRDPALGSRAVPERTRAADNVRFGFTGSLLNAGDQETRPISAWSPGGELFVALPLARWTSIGLRVGYQQFNNGYHSVFSSGPSKETRILGEWSTYAPLEQNRVELGGRVSLGRVQPSGQGESAGAEVSLSGTAVYWFNSWLGGLSEVNITANMFSVPGGDKGDGVPASTTLVSWKMGALVRF